MYGNTSQPNRMRKLPENIFRKRVLRLRIIKTMQHRKIRKPQERQYIISPGIVNRPRPLFIIQAPCFTAPLNIKKTALFFSAVFQKFNISYNTKNFCTKPFVPVLYRIRYMPFARPDISSGLRPLVTLTSITGTPTTFTIWACRASSNAEDIVILPVAGLGYSFRSLLLTTISFTEVVGASPIP